jgi:hypothetical protein
MKQLFHQNVGAVWGKTTFTFFMKAVLEISSTMVNEK